MRDQLSLLDSFENKRKLRKKYFFTSHALVEGLNVLLYLSLVVISILFIIMIVEPTVVLGI